MKCLLFALPATLLAAPALAQHIEYSGRGSATFANFRGENATTTSTVNYNTAQPASSSTINPFGKTLGAGFGAGLRVQRVGKTGLLTAFDLGYDWLQSRTAITQVNYNSQVVGYTRTGSGTTRLYAQSVAAFAGAGWRLGGPKTSLDVLLGPELAYVLTARESGSGSTSAGSWETDTKRSTANTLDFRLRGDLTFWVRRLGLAASYAYGLTNYEPSSSTAARPEAYAGVIRLGLAYRLK